ncbi:uncharacterized protein DNG_06258 [Cephalotrichum gorgonifer]|uniref:Carboxylic ester hydrolase n=1 Tax=Cephalotrichum gorgonifer TaxID=2041049 RepID=A0AAE8MZK1_9PEZI|nr:uncharacterized protein DNG_06258 [Cephalotrichum gorgonifer]
MHTPSIIGLALLLLPGVLAGCTTETFTTILDDHPGATLGRVEAVPEGGNFSDGNFTYATDLPGLCAVSINVKSSDNSSYNFGMFLPDTAWNERLMMTGNGGLGGFINWIDMAVLSHYGFAALSTDTGHLSGPEDGSWGLGAPESLIDWGYRAVHGSVVLGKDIINKYYESTNGIKYSYYSGCSTGGRQGLKEIQTHPDSFDGIVIGAPAWWISHAAGSSLQRGLLNLPESDPKHIGPELFPVIAAELERQCDRQDGLVDGIISDPRGCKFNFYELLCGSGNDTAECLAPEQIRTLQGIYSDVYEDDGATFVYPAVSIGADPAAVLNASWQIGLDYFRYSIYNDTKWDPTGFTYSDQLFADEVDPGQAIADDFDLSAFRDRGGKILKYHGEADPSIAPGDSIYFYEQVQKALGGEAGLDDFYRFFLIPGMGHCAGSAVAPWYVAGSGHAFSLGGATQPVDELRDAEHDVMLAIMEWVEGGESPEKLVATKFVNETVAGGIERQRPLCCSEARPACGYCVRQGMTCDYPPHPQIVHQPHDQIPRFSAQDMRCFQHFMLKCYPLHPLGNEDIWTHEIPCISRTNEHLMHAILAVAASDLAQKDPSLTACAMGHRVKAIQAIKKTLDGVDGRDITYEGANALVATCFALSIQSVRFDDGIVEYMTFIRGLLIVGVKMWKAGIKPIFANLVDKGSQAVLQPHMAALPLIRKQWTDRAVAAVGGLRPLCRDPVEIEYQSLLMDMVQTLYISSWEAYKILEKHYEWWLMLPHEKFQVIIDPGNQVTILLASHWIAIKQIMTPIMEAQFRCRKKDPGKEGGMEVGMIRWLKYLNRQVDEEHRVHNQWPVWVEGQVDRDLGFFGKTR